MVTVYCYLLKIINGEFGCSMDKTAINKVFGTHIKQLRQDRGWSQRDLAAKMGNDYQNISSLERGEYTPTLHAIYRLSLVFEITVVELLAGIEFKS